MKIGILGVSSTGKSTLSKAVSERLGLPLLDEDGDLAAAFEYIKEHKWPMTTTVFPKMNASDNLNFQRAIMEVRKIKFSKYTQYVEDGSPILQVAYLYTHAAMLMPENEFHEWVNYWMDIARNYNAIWYLPYGMLPTVDNGIRITNPHFLQKMDWIIKGLLDRYGIVNANPMYETDLEKRVELICVATPRVTILS